jgi:hypothetical protein
MDATINWLEWFGAARAPSDFDLTVNLSFLSSKEFSADWKLDFDNGKLAFGLMKVTIRSRLNASLVSKIMVFNDEESTKSCCGFQSTERWMALCLSQLTLAFPLWISMLLLLIEGDPNRK